MPTFENEAKVICVYVPKHLFAGQSDSAIAANDLNFGTHIGQYRKRVRTLQKLTVHLCLSGRVLFKHLVSA